MTDGLDCVYYNAQQNFTLQYAVLLAPLCVDDSPATVRRKLGITATYLDILITRRIWNFRAIDYSTMQYAMFIVMRDIRRLDIDELVIVLHQKLDSDEESFSANSRFRLHGQNGKQIHRLLARMTDFVQTQSGMASRYEEYATRTGKNGYEIEHVWANKFERHADEFQHEADFREYRNHLGGLLVLPKKFNASYGALEYGDKLPHYLTQSLLAQSFHPTCYEHNPGFRQFIQKTGLPFKPFDAFKKDDLDARHQLFCSLAEVIWSPSRLDEVAAS